VLVGTGVSVGKGVCDGNGVKVGGTGVAAGAHPLNKTMLRTNPTADKTVFFMRHCLLSNLIAQDCAWRAGLTAAEGPATCRGGFKPPKWPVL
jgi:hypothetical protein